MPGFVVHVGAVVLCSHGGQATPTVPSPRLTVSGQPVVTLSGQYVVAGCPFPPQSGGPCVSGQWLVGTTRVTSEGQPLVIMGGQGLTAPPPTPLLVVTAQTRVTAT
jgi:hypothetical protein